MGGNVGVGGRWRVATDAGGRAGAGAGEGAASASSSSARTTVLRLWSFGMLTNALALAPATIVAPLDFARLPVVSILGALVYGETLDPFVFLGAGIIFSAIYIIITSQTRHRNVATSQP